MKIIVLAGGLSTERDVSLASAAGICNTLLEKGHDAFLLDVFLGLENAPENLEDVFTLPGHGLEIAKNISETEPDLAAVKASRPDQSDCFFGPNVIELCRLADMTFLGLHGGEGENGKLQASFDLLGIRYTGPDSLGCAVAMDKGLTKQIFMEAGVDTPSGVCLYKEDSDCSLESLGLSFPVGSLIYLLFSVTKWGWGFDKYIDEANTGDGLKISKKLKPYFQFILPLLILFILIQGLV